MGERAGERRGAGRRDEDAHRGCTQGAGDPAALSLRERARSNARSHAPSHAHTHGRACAGHRRARGRQHLCRVQVAGDQGDAPRGARERTRAHACTPCPRRPCVASSTHPSTHPPAHPPTPHARTTPRRSWATPTPWWRLPPWRRWRCPPRASATRWVTWWRLERCLTPNLRLWCTPACGSRGRACRTARERASSWATVGGVQGGGRGGARGWNGWVGGVGGWVGWWDAWVALRRHTPPRPSHEPPPPPPPPHTHRRGRGQGAPDRGADAPALSRRRAARAVGVSVNGPQAGRAARPGRRAGHPHPAAPPGGWVRRGRREGGAREGGSKQSKKSRGLEEASTGGKEGGSAKCSRSRPHAPPLAGHRRCAHRSPAL